MEINPESLFLFSDVKVLSCDCFPVLRFRRTPDSTFHFESSRKRLEPVPARETQVSYPSLGTFRVPCLLSSVHLPVGSRTTSVGPACWGPSSASHRLLPPFSDPTPTPPSTRLLPGRERKRPKPRDSHLVSGGRVPHSRGRGRVGGSRSGEGECKG